MPLIKPFRIQILIRLSLIVMAGFATAWLLLQSPFWLAAIWTGLLAILLFVELIRYIELTHRELYQFMVSVEQNDFSNTYISRHKTAKSDLRQVYSRIMHTFQNLRSEKESQHQYLQTVVEHIGQALLCFDQEGGVLLMNKAAKSLFRKPWMRSMESMKHVQENLYNAVSDIRSGEQELVKYTQDGRQKYLSVHATEFKLLDQPHKLISFQDISREMEIQEEESWQKLIRVLTHEITNSVIPIATLSSIMHQMVVAEDKKHIHQFSAEEMEDLRGSLKTIAGRSEALVNFVQNYRNLTEISPLRLSISEFSVEELLSRVSTLLSPRLKERNISLAYSLKPKDLQIKGDFERIEQILINLILNAADAVEGVDLPKVEIMAGLTDDEQLYIQVVDNGKGIEESDLDKIFIPFFTTKARGSGIGLSLTRQIIRMHNGSITVSSEVGKGSVFTLYF